MGEAVGELEDHKGRWAERQRQRGLELCAVKR
jgi:hypothetical protein